MDSGRTLKSKAVSTSKKPVEDSAALSRRGLLIETVTTSVAKIITAPSVADALPAVLTSVVVKDQAGREFGLASQASGDGTLAVVRFAPQASVAEITKFLDAHKAVLAGGPDMQKGGLYKIRLAVTGLPKAEMVKLVQRMQAESKVVEFIATKE